LNRRTLIAGAVVGLLAAILLWPEEKPPEPEKQASEPAATPEPKFRLREPSYQEPRSGYGSARPPSRSDAYSPYPPPRSPSYGYPDAGMGSYAPLEPRSDPYERFSFRPLSERERERLEAERTDPYYAMPPPPQQPYAEWGGQPGAPGSGQASGYPEWYGGGYGYPAYGDYSRERADRRSPYGERREEQDYRGAWPSPPEPQWGSQPRDWVPPAQRMYPSLGAEADRRFTYR